MGDSWVKAYLQDLELELVNFTRLAQKASNLRSALLEVDPSDLSMEQRQSRRMMEHIVNIVCQVVPCSANSDWCTADSALMQLKVYFNLFDSWLFFFVFRCLYDLYVLNICVPSQRTSVTSLGRTRHVRLDKDGRKARSFGFAAFLQFGVAKDVNLCSQPFSQQTHAMWIGTNSFVFCFCFYWLHHPALSALWALESFHSLPCQNGWKRHSHSR